MKAKHIIFDASVFVRFPQANYFHKAAKASSMGPFAFIRKNSIKQEDVCFVLDLLRRKDIEIIILSKNTALSKMVFSAHGLPFDRMIEDLNSCNASPSECGYVTENSVAKITAESKGYMTTRCGSGNIDGILAMSGYKRATLK